MFKINNIVKINKDLLTITCLLVILKTCNVDNNYNIQRIVTYKQAVVRSNDG